MAGKRGRRQQQDEGSTDHPTRLALIATVIELLETTNPEDVKIEDVLGASGISSGSLYYHFDNFPDLIDQAIVARYADDVDVGIAILDEVVQNAVDLTTLREGVRAATARAFHKNRALVRYQRSQVMARSAANARFRDALAPHQARLNDAWAGLFIALQAKGLLDPTVNAMAGSLFVQAYSMGFVVNDVSGYPVTDEDITDLIMRIFERAFFVDERAQ